MLANIIRELSANALLRVSYNTNSSLIKLIHNPYGDPCLLGIEPITKQLTVLGDPVTWLESKPIYEYSQENIKEIELDQRRRPERLFLDLNLGYRIFLINPQSLNNRDSNVFILGMESNVPWGGIYRSPTNTLDRFRIPNYWVNDTILGYYNPYTSPIWKLINNGFLRILMITEAPLLNRIQPIIEKGAELTINQVNSAYRLGLRFEASASIHNKTEVRSVCQHFADMGQNLGWPPVEDMVFMIQSSSESESWAKPTNLTFSYIESE